PPWPHFLHTTEISGIEIKVSRHKLVIQIRRSEVDQVPPEVRLEVGHRSCVDDFLNSRKEIDVFDYYGIDAGQSQIGEVVIPRKGRQQPGELIYGALVVDLVRIAFLFLG